jgi:hypothetical protein
MGGTTDAGLGLLDADQPIRKPEDDRLDRGPFAGQLARAIRSWRGEFSLVIGLCGEWGCGKTSIKNLTLARLDAQPVPRPWCERSWRWLTRRRDPKRVVEFNPWEWSGSDQLARSFFDELGGALGHGGARRAFRRFAGRLVPTAAGASFVSQGAALVLAILAFGIATLDAAPGPAWVLRLRAALGPTGGAHLAAFAVIALAFGAIVTRLKEIPPAAGAAGAGANLEELKGALEKKLLASKENALVVIDDIDRLTPEETRLLFRLVRANANLPRLTYLLLFQHDLVASALNAGKQPGGGAAFLEKIVQVHLDVPPAGPAALRGLLFDGLRQALDGLGAAAGFDEARWEGVFREGLSVFFGTLRQVKRFLAVFEFHLGLFRRDAALEVNPVDLAAIEALRLFSPTVWERVRGARELLLPDPMLTVAGGALEEKAKEQIRSIVADQPRREQIERVISLLFPAAARAWGPAVKIDSELARSKLRVCHPDIFDRYFLLSIEPDAIRQGEVEAFIAAASDRAALTEQLERARSSGRLRALLRVIVGRAGDIPPAPGLPLVQALSDVLDEPLREGEDSPEPFALPPLLLAGRIVYQHAKGIADGLDRFRLLSQAFSECRGLTLPALQISTDLDPRFRQRQPEEVLVSVDQAKELARAWVAKVARAAAEQGPEAFLARPSAGFLLGRWKAWAVGSEFSDWLTRLLDSGDGILALLRAFLTTDRRYGAAARVRRRIDIKSLAELTDLSALRTRVAALDRAILPGADRELLEIFDHSPENPLTDVGWIAGTAE